MEGFTPWAALTGGTLIGFAALLLLLFNGRIAGISGIFGGVLAPAKGEFGWRAAFVGGLLVGGAVMLLLMPEHFVIGIDRSLGAVAAAGLLVGFGTRLGNGCTSGHGVCGLARFSLRSLVATLSFMLAGGITVYVIHHVLGGTL